MKHYPVAKPYIGSQEEKAVRQVLRSGILSIGPEVADFERKFAKRIGARFACAVSSGTAGLHLALVAAGIQKGDEVITSPFSFVASANAILYVGAKPVFVDINSKSFNIDPAQIEARITSRTKAILVVHIFGQAADMKKILALARKHRLKIIEDACESLDAEYYGRKVGTFGESAVFAFYPNKQITTGEGGMIVTNDKKVYQLCRSLRNQGRSDNLKWLDHKILGYNYRLNELSAALGQCQLDKIDFILSQRRRLAAWYTKYLTQHSEFIAVPEVMASNSHSWFVYVVRLKHPKVKRDAVITDLEKVGISAKAYLPSIHLFSFYRKSFKYKQGDFPVAEMISDSSLALPFYIGLKENDIKRITATLSSIVKKHEKRV